MADSFAKSPVPFTLQLFGPPEVALCGGLPVAIAKSTLALLALLVLQPGAGAERSSLATTLWPEAPPSRALFYLRRTLSALRTALGSEQQRLLTPTSTRLAFDLANSHCDVLAFDALTERNDIDSLERALQLYRAPLLEGWTESWVILHREIRSRKYVDSLERLAGLEAQGENLRGAARLLRTAIVSEPLRESSHVRLIEILARLGDHAGAAWQFQNLRRLLRDELNSAPSPAARETFRRLQTQSVQPAEMAPKASAPVSSTPVPASVSESTTAQALRIPCPLTSLIGRKEEIRHVAESVDIFRVVTLVGPGGVGKTRIAIAVAEDRSDMFVEGVWFVDLALAPASGNGIARIVSEAMELPPDSETASEENLCRYLERRRFLLVLDNCEHVAGACRYLIEHLLRRCPFLHILTTSHQPIRCLSEQTISIAPFPLPNLRSENSPTTPAEIKLTAGQVSEIGRNEAVALMLDRVSTGSRAFRLTQRNAMTIVELCRRLDGLPLALEIAASQLRNLTPRQIIARLDDAFQALSLPHRERAIRHRSLRAMVDWSFHLLAPAERALLARLSVFVGGWTLEMCESVCPDTPTAEGESCLLPASRISECLASLVERSLVANDEDSRGRSRYRLLETIRAYTQTQLEEEERQRCLDRLTDYYATLIDTARKTWIGPDGPYWMARIIEELPNLRIALRWCIFDAGEETDTRKPLSHSARRHEIGLTIATRLLRFWYLHGYFVEGRQWIDAALAACDRGNTVSSELAAAAFNASGSLSSYLEDYASAITNHRRALEIRQASGDRRGTAVSFYNLGVMHNRRGEREEAKRLVRNALALYEELGDRVGQINQLSLLGMIALAQDDYDTAEPLLLQVAAYRKETGDEIGLTMIYNSLGVLAVDRGELDKAQSYFHYCLTSKQALGNNNGLLDTMSNVLTLLEAQEKRIDFVRLSAAIEGLRETLRIPIAKVYRDQNTVRPDELRTWSGAEAYLSAWEEGRTMSLAEATAYALQLCGNGNPPMRL